jgi:hypothetical protein
MAATKVSLTLFMEKESNRVLYAEADKEFVDFLLSIFTLPVGVVTRLLKEEGGMVGSLPSFYQSFENLSVTYIQPSKDKRFVLEPEYSFLVLNFLSCCPALAQRVCLVKTRREHSSGSLVLELVKNNDII